MLKCKLSLLFSFCSLILFGQNDVKFVSTQDYLSFLKKKFDININDVYQFEAANDTTFLGKYSSVIFLKGTKISTIEDVRNVDQSVCPPKKLFSNLSLSTIEKSFTEDRKLNSIFFKNLYDNSIIESNDEIIAIFLFSYKIGNSGLQYYKQRNLLERLKIKCILLTLDEDEIADLKQINSTKVIIKK